MRALHIDYLKQRVVIDIDIQDINDKSNSEEESMVFNPGKIILHNVFFCVIEPPDSRSNFIRNDGLWLVNAKPVTSKEMLAKLPVDQLPDGCFVYWFYINDWNAFIYIAYMDACFELGQ